MEFEKSKKNELKENKKRINEDIEIIKARIKVADDLLKSGQSALEEVTKMKMLIKLSCWLHIPKLPQEWNIRGNLKKNWIFWTQSFRNWTDWYKVLIKFFCSYLVDSNFSVMLNLKLLVYILLWTILTLKLDEYFTRYYYSKILSG